jgi:hypothetical protein
LCAFLLICGKVYDGDSQITHIFANYSGNVKRQPVWAIDESNGFGEEMTVKKIVIRTEIPVDDRKGYRLWFGGKSRDTRG